jgi:hypothetical protein
MIREEPLPRWRAFRDGDFNYSLPMNMSFVDCSDQPTNGLLRELMQRPPCWPSRR